eukprot:365658-Chlamydomonas_euryale.AAC.18
MLIGFGDRASPIVAAAESSPHGRPQSWVCGSKCDAFRVKSVWDGGAASGPLAHKTTTTHAAALRERAHQVHT